MRRDEIRHFRETVLGHFEKHGRSFLWRLTTDPYEILVSEVMLQQTRTDRVAAYFPRFIARFPDIATLAAAPLREVLALWQGLGYNRRALFLKKCAEATLARHDGILPDTIEALTALPGIGPYTARAVITFAFNKPHLFIETNIRTAYLHHFFPGREKVSDRELMPFIESTLDRDDPRRWYYALMDYGVHLKKLHPNPSRRSAHHTKQSRFEGSDRQMRGAILRALAKTALSGKRLSTAAALDLGKEAIDVTRFTKILGELCAEGLVVKKGRSYLIP